MRHLTVLALIQAASLAACTPASDPLASVDREYTELMVDLGVADRDTARNVRNKEARRHKSDAEKARVAFFQSERVRTAIDAASAAPDGSTARLKAEAYQRQMLLSRSWTPDEKAEETRLLGRLEEARSAPATWSPPDGTHQIDLARSWSSVSKDADDLAPADREMLAAEYIDHRMAVVGADLQQLIRLRNKVAQREGYASYWHLALASQGLSPEDVDGVITDLSAVVAPINAEVSQRIAAAAAAANLTRGFAHDASLRRAAGLEAGRDEADAFFDTDLAEERVTTALRDMGIPSSGWQVYSGPERYFRPGVYGFPIRPPGSVAIVMSQSRRWSVWQYEALAHEGGHAIWWNNLAGDRLASPALWQPAAPWFEGFAQFFERVVYTPEFTAAYVPELPEAQRVPLSEWRARHSAVAITDSLVDTLVERRLYEDPNNLESVARYAAQTRAQLTGAPAPPPTDGGMPWDPSLVSTLLWNYPAYSQNYLFAYLTEAWMYEAIVATAGEPLVGNPKVGPAIIKIIQAPADQPLRDSLAALFPGDRSEPLRRYLKGPPPPTAPSDTPTDAGTTHPPL